MDNVKEDIKEGEEKEDIKGEEEEEEEEEEEDIKEESKKNNENNENNDKEIDNKEDLKEEIIGLKEEIKELTIIEAKPLVISMSPTNIEFYLKKMGLGVRRLGTPEELLTKRKEGERRRNKRKYIRKRLKEGKPYIPANIRQLGKEEAARQGYDDWSHLPTGHYTDLELIKSLIEDIIGTAVDIEKITDGDIKISSEVMERQKRALSMALGIKRDGLEKFINHLITVKEQEVDEKKRVESERDALMPKIAEAIRAVREQEDRDRQQPKVVSYQQNGIIKKEIETIEKGEEIGEIEEDNNKEKIEDNNLVLNRDLLQKEIGEEIEEGERINKIEEIEGIEKEVEEIEKEIETEIEINDEINKDEKEIEFKNIPSDDPLKIICLSDERKKRALCFVYTQLNEIFWGTDRAEKLFYNVLKSGLK